MSNIVYCEKLPYFDGYSVFVDGRAIKDENDLLLCLWEQFRMPEKAYYGWQDFYSWMKNLEWIEEESVNIVIKDFDYLASKMGDKIKYLLEDMRFVIFPFWDGVENGKEITVYCISDAVFSELPSTRSILGQIATKLRKESLSDNYTYGLPVLRQSEGKLYLSLFLILYTEEEKKNAILRRPSIYLLSDIKDGKIVKIYNTTEGNDFCDASYEERYNSFYIPPLSNPWIFWDSCNVMLDILRYQYLNNEGAIYKELYLDYIDRISWTMPSDLQGFYYALDNVLINEELCNALRNKELEVDEE